MFGLAFWPSAVPLGPVEKTIATGHSDVGVLVQPPVLGVIKLPLLFTILSLSVEKPVLNVTPEAAKFRSIR